MSANCSIARIGVHSTQKGGRRLPKWSSQEGDWGIELAGALSAGGKVGQTVCSILSPQNDSTRQIRFADDLLVD